MRRWCGWSARSSDVGLAGGGALTAPAVHVGGGLDRLVALSSVPSGLVACLVTRVVWAVGAARPRSAGLRLPDTSTPQGDSSGWGPLKSDMPMRQQSDGALP